MSLAESLAAFFEQGRPIQDYVAIKRLPTELRTKTGLYIPATAAEERRPYQGIVMSVGPGRFNGKGVRQPAPDLKPGDHVYFGKYAGAESAVESNDFWLVRYELIDAVLEEQSDGR